MTKLPVLKVSKNGKRYFVVNGRKVFIEAKMTKPEIIAIYKVLLKNVPSKRVNKNVNKATAVIKQYISNQPARKRRHNTQKKKKDDDKPFVSTIDEANRVSKSSGNSGQHPKDSGNEDKINSLTNKLNQLMIIPRNNPPAQPAQPGNFLVPRQPPPNITEKSRFNAMQQDPRYMALLPKMLNPSDQDKQDFNNLLADYGFLAPDIPPVKPLKPSKARFRPSSNDSVSSVKVIRTKHEKADDIHQLHQENVEVIHPLHQENVEYIHPLHQENAEDIHPLHHENVEEKPPEDLFKLSEGDVFSEISPETDVSSVADSGPDYNEKIKQPLFQSNLKPKPKRASKPKQGVKVQHKASRADAGAYGQWLKKNNIENTAIRWIQFLNERHGNGNAGGETSDGLYNDEINKVMSNFPSFLGCIMRNEIKTILPYVKPQSMLSFIINTDNNDKPGNHWCAVYIDSSPKGSHSVEWYDSFARPMPEDIKQDVKLILKCLKPSTILKLKENAVLHQKDDSSNCGYFCIKFLIDRYRNKTFAEATGYDDRAKIDDSHFREKQIENLKDEKPFSYILAD